MSADLVEARIDAYMRKHARLWSRRFFRATVTATGATISGTGTLCTVVDIADAGGASHSAMCATPSYTPAIGDDVECMWRDEETCYVLWAL